MNEYLMLSIKAGTALYFGMYMIIAIAVYAVGLFVEWRRRK